MLPFRYRSLFPVLWSADLAIVYSLMLLAAIALAFGVLTQTERIISVVMTLVAILMFAVFLVQHSRIRALEAALEDHIERGDRLRGHILWMNGELDESLIVVRAAQLGFHLHQ